MEEREYFPFYLSFYEALKHLPYKERCALCYAIVQYGITDTEDEHKLTGGAAATFEVIKPVLHLSYQRSKARQKQNKSGTNAEQNDNQKPLNNDNDNDNNNDNNISSLRERVTSSKKSYQKPSPFVVHGELSPMMREAAERLRKEEMA